MANDHTAILQQIDGALELMKNARARSKWDDLSDLKEELPELVTVLADIIQRFAPAGSAYRQKADELVRDHGTRNFHIQQEALHGIVKALRRAYASGYLKTVQELVHASMFADFFEMAEYLLADGYKDAAAVIAGSVLEENIRNLCILHVGLTTDAKGHAKKASVMNDELAKAGAYDKLQQKSITAWLDLRNKAAHGEFGAYDQKQVELYMHGIRDFLMRYPA